MTFQCFGPYQREMTTVIHSLHQTIHIIFQFSTTKDILLSKFSLFPRRQDEPSGQNLKISGWRIPEWMSWEREREREILIRTLFSSVGAPWCLVSGGGPAQWCPCMAGCAVANYQHITAPVSHAASSSLGPPAGHLSKQVKAGHVEIASSDRPPPPPPWGWSSAGWSSSAPLRLCWPSRPETISTGGWGSSLPLVAEITIWRR